MNSRKYEYCYFNFHRASSAKHLKSKKHSKNEKSNEKLITEWLFQEPVENNVKNMYNLNH